MGLGGTGGDHRYLPRNAQDVSSNLTSGSSSEQLSQQFVQRTPSSAGGDPRLGCRRGQYPSSSGSRTGRLGIASLSGPRLHRPGFVIGSAVEPGGVPPSFQDRLHPGSVGSGLTIKCLFAPADSQKSLGGPSRISSAPSGNVCALDQLTKCFVLSVAVAPDDVAADHRVLLLV